jgi:hypothetical protein
MTHPLLCSECEQRFSRNGEAYVIPKLSKGNTFPLLDALKAAVPAVKTPQWTAFRGDQVGLETEKMAYFALSLLWRASVHEWQTLRGQTTSVVIDEPFKEDLRRYLLGETGFPTDTVVVATVATDKISQETFFVPNRITKNPMIAYGLMNKGLYFRVFFGSDLPREMRPMCCASGAEKFIFMRDCEDNLLEAFGRLMATSVPIGALAKSPVESPVNATRIDSTPPPVPASSVGR